MVCRKDLDRKFHFILFVVLLLFSMTSYSQTVIRGEVINQNTHEIISQVTIVNDSLNLGTSTDQHGVFTIRLPAGKKSIWIECRAFGYETKQVELNQKDPSLIIELIPKQEEIQEVTITGKQKYKKRGNPAVELIKQVINHKRINRLHNQTAIQYEQYEKMKVGLIMSSSDRKRKAGSFDFFFQNIDTISHPERVQLPLFLKESQSKIFSQQNPKNYKKIIFKEKQTKFDPRYINNENIQEFIDNVFSPVDIYDESLYLIRKQFLSPIANTATVYYQYYIQDTVMHEGQPYVQLFFRPANKKDLLLQGTIEVSLDGRYAVRKAAFGLDEGANVNFIKDLEINLDYSPNEEGVMLLDQTHVYAVLGINKSGSFFGETHTVHSQYDLISEIDPKVFAGTPIVEMPEADQQGTSISRPIALSDVEQNTYVNVDSLNNLASFKRLAALGYLLAQGYYNMGYFELGPLEYLYSQNNIEGQRVRIGGRTTAALSNKMYMEGYIAYGFDDQNIKYNLRTAVSLNGNNITRFPAHYIEATVQKDIFEPGRNIGFRKGDSFFQSFRKNRPTKWIDTEAYKLGHIVEFGNHVSIHSSFLHHRRLPIGSLQFISSDPSGNLQPNINTNEAELMVRWAPYERFYHRNLERKPIVDKHPVVLAKYNKGLNGFWGGHYNYDKLTLGLANRFFLNQLGFFDFSVEVGNYWGNLPYPLLEIPTYTDENTRNSISYDLINSMEFVADRYAKVALDHQLQGYILNKIPLIKKLKLREIWGAKFFAGRLSAQNDPSLSPTVIEFEKDENGNTLTHPMNQGMYTEGYFGLDNIFKVLKIQYIQRLSYKKSPTALKDQIRFSLDFSF